MTISIARLHSTFFVDYLRIDPQLDMDRMLQKSHGHFGRLSHSREVPGHYSAFLRTVVECQISL